MDVLIANAIVSRLKSLKPVVEGDDEKSIQLVDTVEVIPQRGNE